MEWNGVLETFWAQTLRQDIVRVARLQNKSTLEKLECKERKTYKEPHEISSTSSSLSFYSTLLVGAFSKACPGHTKFRGVKKFI